MMISFELKPAGAGVSQDEIEINLDREGLDALMAQLRLIDSGRTDHIHLMAESWGGSHLAERPLARQNMAVRHVKIMLRENTQGE